MEAFSPVSIIEHPYHNCYVALIPSVFVMSSFGGLILDKTVTDPNFEGMAVFTPVINGKLIGF